MFAIAVLMLFGGVLAACNTTDPNRGGFIGGVVGAVSGNYDDYVEKRRRIRDEELRKLEAVEVEVTELEAEREKLVTQLGGLRRDIASHRRAGRLSEAEAARMTARASELEAKVERMKSAEVDAKKLAGLRAETKLLREEIELRLDP
jgi:septal ring factor EnvC (AmiA/AmiB activator)